MPDQPATSESHPIDDPPAARRGERALCSATVFFASAAVLVLETLAARLLAPYIGDSLETYTSIIGVCLAGIAAGAWIGGRLADEFDPRPLIPVALIGGGALAMASIPIIRGFGPTATPGEPVTTVFLAGCALFLPSMVLSTISPLVVKLRLGTVEATGRVVGGMSALATVGSLVGTFTTGFVLVAQFPTRAVVTVLGSTLVVAGVAMWLVLRRPVPAVVVAIGLVLAAGSVIGAVAVDRPCDVETRYYCANVETDPDRPTGRRLILDDLTHAYVDLADPTVLELRYTQWLGDVVDAMPEGRVDTVHLGGGGFTIPRYVQATRPGSTSAVLEIDPAVVDVAEQHLGLVPGAGLTAITGDARVNLRELGDATADLIVGDAFGGRAVPWHLTTREFVGDIRRVLRSGGIYAQNLIDQPPLRLLRADVATLRTVFEHVAVLAPAERLDGTIGGNAVVIASDSPLPLDRIAASEAARGGDAVLLAGGPGLDAFVDDAMVLTDDFAPTDQLIGG